MIGRARASAGKRRVCARAQELGSALLFLAGEPRQREEMRRRRHAAIRPHNILLHVLRHGSFNEVTIK